MLTSQDALIYTSFEQFLALTRTRNVQEPIRNVVANDVINNEYFTLANFYIKAVTIRKAFEQFFNICSIEFHAHDV